mmetsp:Transcript_41152/g.74342  ORF Transcript_41152/g.74342 Transcript_41152/m.74342 type:complete len:243 (-) Transcript_41152:444-1172(-)
MESMVAKLAKGPEKLWHLLWGTRKAVRMICGLCCSCARSLIYLPSKLPINVHPELPRLCSRSLDILAVCLALDFGIKRNFHVSLDGLQLRFEGLRGAVHLPVEARREVANMMFQVSLDLRACSDHLMLVCLPGKCCSYMLAVSLALHLEVKVTSQVSLGLLQSRFNNPRELHMKVRDNGLHVTIHEFLDLSKDLRKVMFTERLYRRCFKALNIRGCRCSCCLLGFLHCWRQAPCACLIGNDP